MQTRRPARVGAITWTVTIVWRPLVLARSSTQLSWLGPLYLHPDRDHQHACTYPSNRILVFQLSDLHCIDDQSPADRVPRRVGQPLPAALSQVQHVPRLPGPRDALHGQIVNQMCSAIRKLNGKSPRTHPRVRAHHRRQGRQREYNEARWAIDLLRRRPHHHPQSRTHRPRREHRYLHPVHSRRKGKLTMNVTGQMILLYPFRLPALGEARQPFQSVRAGHALVHRLRQPRHEHAGISTPTPRTRALTSCWDLP